MRVYYLRVSVTFETQTCLLFVDMPEERHYGHRGRKYVCNKNTMLQLLFVCEKETAVALETQCCFESHILLM